MRRREVLLAAVIGVILGFLALVTGYGNDTPKGIAIMTIGRLWWLGFVFLLLGFFLDQRRSAARVSRILGVLGGAWVGIVAGWLALILVYRPGF